MLRQMRVTKDGPPDCVKTTAEVDVAFLMRVGTGGNRSRGLIRVTKRSSAVTGGSNNDLEREPGPEKNEQGFTNIPFP